MIDLTGIEVIVIGGSAGGINAITEALKPLPRNFPVPIIIVLHRLKNVPSKLRSVIQFHTRLHVKEADEKELIKPHYAYLAPANYHLLIEKDRSFALDYSEVVKYSRPSIDLTLECIASVYGDMAVGILLTGANSDGAAGLLAMKKAGARCFTQDPKTAEVATMPQAALDIGASDKVITLNQIGLLLKQSALGMN